MVNNETIDEIVRYILQNGGPGEKGRAHPILKISVGQLELALRSLPAELSSLRPYHFQFIGYLWRDKDRIPTKYAREVSWMVIQEHVSKGHYKDLNDFIESFSWDNFRNGILIDHINKREITINTEKMLRLAYGSCAPEAVLDCVRNNFKGYEGLGFEHLSYRPNNVYADKVGNPTEAARRVVGKLVPLLLRKKYSRDLNRLIENVDTYDFTRVKLTEEIAGHVFTIDTRLVLFRGFKKSPAAAILDYIRNDTKLKDQYKGLDIEHFSNVKYIWRDRQGEFTDKARKVTERVINHHIAKEEFRDFNDMICSIGADHFNSNPLSDRIAGHDFQINTSTLMRTYGGPVRAVLDYIKHDPDLSKKYHGLGIEHFPNALNKWSVKNKPTKTARRVTGRLIQQHIFNNTYPSLNDFITKADQKDFKNGILVDEFNGCRFPINTEGVLDAYNNSPIYTVLDFIMNSEHAISYKKLNAEHFSYYPLKYLNDDFGRPTENARRILIKFFNYLIDNGFYSDLNDLIEKITGKVFISNPMYEKIAGKKFKVNTYGLLNTAYNMSPARAILDFVRNTPNFRELYKKLGIEHIGHVANTWADEDGNPTDKAREVTGRLVQYLIKKKRFKDFNFMIENIVDDDFSSNPMTERIAGHDFPIKTSSLLLDGYHNSPARAVLDYIKHDGLLWLKYAGLKLYHFSSVRNIWVDKEKNPTAESMEVLDKLVKHLMEKRNQTVDKCLDNLCPADFKGNILFDEFEGHRFYINTASMLESAHQKSVIRAVKFYRENIAA